MRTRRADLGDLEALQALEHACFPDAWSRESLLSELEQRHGRTWVLVDAGQVIGSVLAWKLFEELQVNRVAIRPDLQGKGLGRRLLAHALEEAQREGARAVLLEVRADNLPAIRLYERLGLRRTGVRRRYYADGADAWVMTAELRPVRAQPRALVAGVYPLLDTDRLGWTAETLPNHAADLQDYAEAAADAGATVLQLRVKSLPLGHPLRAELFGRLLDRVGERLLAVVDDDVEALLPWADRPLVGLHLGQDDLAPQVARQRLGPAVVLGWSTHAAPQVALSADLPVDYVGFGPIRATASKHAPDPVTGLHALAAAARGSLHPVVAIGGLEGEDLPGVRATGAAAAAVIGAWLGPAGRPHSPPEAGRALAALVRAWQGGSPRAEAAHDRDGGY